MKPAILLTNGTLLTPLRVIPHGAVLVEGTGSGNSARPRRSAFLRMSRWWMSGGPPVEGQIYYQAPEPAP
ncbi:hypothetical protein EDC14_103935 [Hydrogenispora ethanolica]|uniref:Uncharacterized protein n=1 Tax=Hydrogenispora ethanolica TaxID=1082276 RepID=A0A4R1R1P0_HYDET|nr:hypothetical protein [Hydrogenispora ethanolica]TCL59255.1 hypothetical protein EDC14_103935 [Hydrogenispora ethanolica]